MPFPSIPSAQLAGVSKSQALGTASRSWEQIPATLGGPLRGHLSFPSPSLEGNTHSDRGHDALLCWLPCLAIPEHQAPETQLLPQETGSRGIPTRRPHAYTKVMSALPEGSHLPSAQSSLASCQCSLLTTWVPWSKSTSLSEPHYTPFSRFLWGKVAGDQPQRRGQGHCVLSPIYAAQSSCCPDTDQ